MVGAKVNGRLVTIDYEIQNGDRIEILTSANSRGPSMDWLKIVKSTQAKNKISQWFKTELKEDNILRGKNMMTEYAKTKGIKMSDIMKSEYQEVCLRKYGFRDWDSLLAAIGHGSLKEGQIVNRLYEEWKKEQNENLTEEQILNNITEQSANRPRTVHHKGSIIVRGMDDVAVHFSKCCAPVPGDEIIGYVTRGRGVTIHRTDCVNMIHLPESDKVRLIDAEWNFDESGKDDHIYNAEIRIFARNNPGVLLDIMKILSEEKVNINSVAARPGKNDISTINVSFAVHSTAQLTDLINRIGTLPNVVDIERTTG